MSNLKREIIFAYTQQRGEEKLKEILSRLPDDEIVLEHKRDCIRTNKRNIRVVPYSIATRGYRCTTAYVDKNMPIWTLHELVYPILRGSSDGVQYF